MTQLVSDNEVCDEFIVCAGFRNVEFREDGFYLNGNKRKLFGLNRHQSYPYVGYAMPDSMQILDADILKYELGLNAVRTSHYPQSHAFINRCDEIGLLVFMEIPSWQYIGDETWKNQAVKNTEDMVKQYRNHTSIILWGVRINESKDDDSFYKKTNETAKKFDNTRATAGVRAHKKSSLLEDVYTYNDFVHTGKNHGCQKKKHVTSDCRKPYLTSYLTMIKLMILYRMKLSEISELYGRYIGNWGGIATKYRFDAVKNRNVVKSIEVFPWCSQI